MTTPMKRFLGLRRALHTEVTGMSSAMNEKHAFAQIERRLAREDPGLARRINAINSQFPDLADEQLMAQADERLTYHSDGRVTDRAVGEDVANQPEDGGDERAWTAMIAVVLAAVAILGLLLTAILSSPSSKPEPLQPHGLAPPAASDVLEERPSRVTL